MTSPYSSRRVVSAIGLVLACGGERESSAVVVAGGPRPDELPVMLNPQPPFQYPPVLYASKVQGNVMLRLHIDSDGNVKPESTVVVETSGYPALDSAAVRGSEALRFVPARTNGESRAVSVLFPVLFRHPDAPPLPGDTALHPRSP